jgi:AraC-like DNA-binding protein
VAAVDHIHMCMVAEGQCGGVEFWLRVADTMEPKDVGVVGYAFVNAPTLRRATETVFHLAPLLSEAFVMKAEVHRRDVLLAEAPSPYGTLHTPSSVAANIAIWVRFVRLVHGEGFAPSAVYFRLPAFGSKRAFESFFRAPVYFDQPRNAFEYARRWFDETVPGADPWLFEFFTAYGERLLNQLLQVSEDEGDLVELARRHLQQAVQMGTATVDELGRRLGMGGRTLQRKLTACGSSYRALLSEVRAELAEQLLMDPSLSTAKVAEMLGYSHPTAFHRAFLAWTGTTPQAFRAAGMDDGPASTGR